MTLGHLIVVVPLLLVIAGFIWLLNLMHTPEPILSFVCAILVGFLVLLYAVKLFMGYSPHPAIAATASFTGHVYMTLASFAVGFLFYEHMKIAYPLCLLTSIFVQGWLYRSLIRAGGRTLGWGKAILIALLSVAGDFFVSSPIVAWVLGEFSNK
jgi:hypothetical protein